jgi:hypothetical protein
MNRISNNLNKLAAIIEAMPVPQPEQPARTVRDAWGTSAAAPPAAPEARELLPMMACEVLSRELWGPVDPLQPDTFPDAAWGGGGTAPLDVVVDGVVAARFTRTESAPWSSGTYELALDAYVPLCEQHGSADTGESAEGAWDAEGAAAMREVLPPAAMLLQPMHDYRGSLEVRLRIAEARGRDHGMTPEAIASVTGRPYVARKSLIPPCGRSRELEEQRRDREMKAAEGAKAAAAAAAQIEIARDRTFAELRVCAVAVKIGRLADGLTTAQVFARTHQWRTSEPWTGASVLFATADEVYYGHRVVPGCAMPKFSRDGVRSIDPSEIAPRSMGEVVDASPAAMLFMHERKVEAGENLGAVRNLQAEVWPASAALIAVSARVLLSPSPSHAHRMVLLAEQLVRSRDCQLRPDAALRAVLGHASLDGEFRRLRPAVEIPYGALVRSVRTGELTGPLPTRSVQSYADHELPSRALVGPLGQALVRAVSIGSYVPAGSKLLAEPWPSLDAPSPAPMESEKASEESTSATAKRKSR